MKFLEERVFSTKTMPIVIILISLAGFFIGMYFYWNQVINTPTYLWLFVIDCPLYVLLSVVVIALRMKGRSNKILNYITSVGLIKYGLWTVLAIILNQGDILFFALPHMLMVIFGFLLIPYSRAKFTGFLLIMGWFLFNDYMDYVVGTVPPIPMTYMELIAYFSLFSTVFFVSLVYTINRFMNQNKQL
ncbi:MAG: DUF1405 domain-containing protein [Nanoarchaeota archaeon]|nr:DUF1405 domain-containing protein [Nanoarchaeota archaeon]MBU2520014.1 DUF1405 domain-containing protein [Nanoarchaeota archaeon]